MDAAQEFTRKQEQSAAGRTNAHAYAWRADDTCGYCGSMTVERAIALLKTPGTHYSGADWKYGWPHKFYIGQKKFYNEHLKDATPERLAEFSRISERLLGISWDIHEGRLRWKAVPGIQKWGTVSQPEVQPA